MKAAVRLDHELGDRLPHDVGSAIELLRYEKIGRWEGVRWVWSEGPGHHPSARQIADGKRDGHKQDALYVRIARDGRIASTPEVITEDETQDEFARAGRYHGFMKSLMQGDQQTDRYDKAMTVLRRVFSHRG